jgi:hypothetical protein
MFEMKIGGTRFDLDAIRRQQSALMPDGGHAWVIHVVHAVEEPEEALDMMELDEKSFVGVSDIACLMCHEVYSSVNRFYKCSQQLPGGSNGQV